MPVFQGRVLMAEEIPMARVTLGRDDFSDFAVDRIGSVARAGEGEVVTRVDLFSLTTNNITCAVGSAQSLEPPKSSFKPPRELSGARPEFFFVPTWIAKRQRDWSAAGFEQRVGEATEAFYAFVGMSPGVLELIEHDGLEAVSRLVADLVAAGRVDPARAISCG